MKHILALLLLAAQLHAKPLKVFILAGQSNMEGHAKIETFDYIGDDSATAPLLKMMRDEKGEPRVCDHTWISYFTGKYDGSANGEGTGKLTAGYGARDDGEIIPLILDYRGAEKLAQQAASLLDCVKPDGRIHGRFDPTGTATGRFASKEPNLQNVGRGELRECFIPCPGHKLIVADYSQIELRAAAVIAGEKKMIEAYRNGVDLHKQTAAEVLGKPLEDVSKADRQTGKAASFGLLYGQSAPGLVRYAASSYGVHLEPDQAEKIRRQFFRTYDRLRQWHGVSRNKADEGAREVRTVLGRRRLIPETASEWERFTALVNTPVQGGAADGMKQALVLIAERLPDGARLISTVHDEVLVEAPESIAGQVCELVRSSMIEAMASLFPQVPIEVEAGVCAHWGEK